MVPKNSSSQPRTNAVSQALPLVEPSDVGQSLSLRVDGDKIQKYVSINGFIKLYRTFD